MPSPNRTLQLKPRLGQALEEERGRRGRHVGGVSSLPNQTGMGTPPDSSDDHEQCRGLTHLQLGGELAEVDILLGRMSQTGEGIDRAGNH